MGPESAEGWVHPMVSRLGIALVRKKGMKLAHMKERNLGDATVSK